MKIVRFRSQSGQVLYGALDPDIPDHARIIEGDIFADSNITDRVEHIAVVLPPVSPPNIIALGLNYGRHAKETGLQSPEIPVMFLKGTNSVIGHGAPIILPSAGPSEVDFEAELAVIIAKPARNIHRDNVSEYVLGYTCGNDISARDWQIHKQHNQWARGKSFDTFCPIGPYLVTTDEIISPDCLNLRSILNGEVMQDSNTSDMLFDIPAIISNLSCSMTLLPGTVILTGTPDGVGFTRTPPVFLRDGDIITISIEKIGELSNSVRREQSE